MLFPTFCNTAILGSTVITSYSIHYTKLYEAEGKKRSLPGRDTQTRFTNVPSFLLAIPGIEFCSWIMVGTPMSLAATITGPVTYPPRNNFV